MAILFFLSSSVQKALQARVVTRQICAVIRFSSSHHKAQDERYEPETATHCKEPNICQALGSLLTIVIIQEGRVNYDSRVNARQKSPVQARVKETIHCYHKALLEGNISLVYSHSNRFSTNYSQARFQPT